MSHPDHGAPASAPLGPGPRTRVRRQPAKARYDERVIYQIFDEARFCHVAGVVDGRALVLPTLHVREGRSLYLHASRSNALLAAVVAAGEACVTATLYDGLRLARSGFESSIAYRSAVAFGPATAVRGLAERRRWLDHFAEATLPGRGAEVRALRDDEVRRTMVVRVDIVEASAKVSAGPTEDDEEDRARPIWSGVVPAHVAFDAPIPSRDGAMADGALPVPASVRHLLGHGAARDALRARLASMTPVDAREAASIRQTLDRLDVDDDPFDENASDHHLTASAFVVSERGVILHRHRRLGIWVQPGGHVDPDETPESAARRETREETGLVARHLDPSALVHVDVHPGPRGHTHYDLRYVLVAPPEDPRPPAGESPEVAWFSFADALERAEPSLRAALVDLARRYADVRD